MDSESFLLHCNRTHNAAAEIKRERDGEKAMNYDEM